MTVGPITDHAVIRFLERHDGFDLRSVRTLVGRRDGDALAYLAVRCGIDVGAVRRRMLTPHVAAGLRLGASSVVVGSVRLVIANGRVVTVKCVAWGRLVRPANRGLPSARPQPRRERRRYGDAALALV